MAALGSLGLLRPFHGWDRRVALCRVGGGRLYRQAGRPVKLADFRGRWRLTRRIDDARAGVVGRLDGQALFTVEAQGLVLTETGLLRYG
ncbi:MAG: DUF6314 family protein, partial [Roseovarius sp.]|uniref:DUF6314 family protein n=1 Tax=Roseovarius sp. TaxID=1486281 RepID=UPI0040588F90